MEVQTSSDEILSARQIETLSWPRDTATSRAEASSLLRALTTTDAVANLYLTFAKHKTILPAIHHLELSGGRLDELSFSTAIFLKRGNVSRTLTGTHVTGPLVSLSRVGSIYDRLDRLLTDLEGRIVARFEGRLMLLHGRALRASYPDYPFVFSHDLDFFGLDTKLVNDWFEEMGPNGEFTLDPSAVSPVRSFARCRLHKHEEGFLLKADMIVGGRLGRGSIPPFTLDPWPRARMVHIRDKVAFVPSTEDMILMVAEKMRRHGIPLRRHFNDVRFLVLAHQDTLDWAYINRAAEKHRLVGMMHWLIDDLRHQEGRDFTPSGVLVRRRSTTLESRMVRLIREPDSAAGWPHRPQMRSRLWQVYWFVTHLHPSRDAFHMLVERASAHTFWRFEATKPG